MPFDRHQPVRWMNGAKLVQRADLKRVFLIGRFHRAVPGAMEFLQHLLGRGAPRIDNPLQRLEMTALVTAKLIDAAAPPQPRTRQRQTYLCIVEYLSCTDPGPQPEAR